MIRIGYVTLIQQHSTMLNTMRITDPTQLWDAIRIRWYGVIAKSPKTSTTVRGETLRYETHQNTPRVQLQSLHCVLKNNEEKTQHRAPAISQKRIASETFFDLSCFFQFLKFLFFAFLIFPVLLFTCLCFPILFFTFTCSILSFLLQIFAVILINEKNVNGQFLNKTFFDHLHLPMSSKCQICTWLMLHVWGEDDRVRSGWSVHVSECEWYAFIIIFSIFLNVQYCFHPWKLDRNLLNMNAKSWMEAECQELPSCRAPKLYIASVVVADLANTWWIWPWGHFVPELTGAQKPKARKDLFANKPLTSEPSDHARSTKVYQQFVRRSAVCTSIILGSKASGKQSNDYGGDCCNAITFALAMSLPSNSRQDARPPWRASYPAYGFLKTKGNHTHRPIGPKCPRLSTWHDRSRGPRGWEAQDTS